MLRFGFNFLREETFSGADELNPHPSPPPSLLIEKGEAGERDEFGFGGFAIAAYELIA